ncbi:MAG TPA: hypothetical protein VMX13_08955 [Sedimentisphaerales bacterium]|nr:hypothetical protein [Sedimentisphaerales bacterium]
MESKRTEHNMARRPFARRAIYLTSVTVLCALLVLSFILLAHKSAPAGKLSLTTTYAPREPNIASSTDRPPAVAATTARSVLNQSPDRQFADLLETTTTDVAEQAELILPAKISDLRSKLLKTLSKETTLQSVENLPNYDDTQKQDFIQNATTLDSYDCLFQLIPDLTRVRKILQDTPNSPNAHEVIARLMAKLSYSTHGYAEVLLAFREARRKDRESVRTSVPHEWERRQAYSAAAVYLLSELHAYEALPLMSKVYFSQEKLPLSRLFVFYAMHLLVVDYPRKELSPQAQNALDAYLQAAADLPKPIIRPLTTWKAAYDETDVRVSVIHQDLLRNQPRLQVRIYPPEFRTYETASWGTPQTDPHWLKVDPQIDDLAGKLKAFIDAAYPESSDPN